MITRSGGSVLALPPCNGERGTHPFVVPAHYADTHLVTREYGNLTQEGEMRGCKHEVSESCV